jgi:hypothetical protein
VRLLSDSAVAIEHLSGIMSDLRATIGYCDAYERCFTDSTDEAIQDALWKAALVTYARCFQTGVRKSERPNLELLEAMGDARKAHDYFIAIRSKYVAHSVNALETNITYAVLTNDPGQIIAARGPGAFHISSNPLNEEGTKALRTLAVALLQQAESRNARLVEATAEELRSMTQEELAALPTISAHQAPDVEHINLTRQ